MSCNVLLFKASLQQTLYKPLEELNIAREVYERARERVIEAWEDTWEYKIVTELYEAYREACKAYDKAKGDNDEQ